MPPTGDRTTTRVMEMGAVFEARRLLERAEREAAARQAREGTRTAVAGDGDRTDVGLIWSRLDRARERCPDLVLRHKVCHKGAPGAERIVAA